MKAGADFEKGADAPANLDAPFVCSVILDRILRSVVFPAPFRPITPTTLPAGTSNDTSRSAQMRSLGSSRKARLRNSEPKRRTGAVMVSVIVSRSVR